MFRSKGDRLESLVQYVYQVLSNSSNQKIEVINKHDIIGKSGVKHNIDVYYQFKLNGITHKVIFECKNWKTKISKEKVLAFKSILDDIPNSAGIMIAPKGYQSGAKQFAEHHGIELVSGSEKSLLALAAGEKLKVILPDESVVGQPFYCIMENGGDNQVTGTYMRNISANGESFLRLFFSKVEAIENSNLMYGETVVRGLDKKHLAILCDYSENFELQLAIQPFLQEQALGVEPRMIRDYFLD
ncbi:restriction endonuclease [Enterococcus casseliflavus]|uniref:restriction endonuclease n=1 Tax=Enterococcus casseliflavus TaxID=37734 RepID=UPI002DBD8DC7|nr:restriction endonuclease [Enterococcus casseliflavus]MEB8399159.1 restriction endonuclease [Enterococcus casseliflavus]